LDDRLLFILSNDNVISVMMSSPLSKGRLKGVVFIDKQKIQDAYSMTTMSIFSCKCFYLRNFQV